MAKSVRSITQKAVIAAPPEQVYQALVQARVHATFTGGAATGAARVGGKFTAWDGYILGVHRVLVPGERVVQDWWTTEWPDGAEPSQVEWTLSPARSGGTTLTLRHTGVPASQADALRQGWIDFYWTPLKAYFSGR